MKAIKRGQVSFFYSFFGLFYASYERQTFFNKICHNDSKFKLVVLVDRAFQYLFLYSESQNKLPEDCEKTEDEHKQFLV